LQVTFDPQVQTAAMHPSSSASQRVAPRHSTQRPFSQTGAELLHWSSAVQGAHTPSRQAGRFPEQTAQVLPSVPHAPGSDPARQVVPSQQPEQVAFVQVADALRAHTPFRQIIPVQQLNCSSQ
jgi:hypothetical protein